MPTPSIERRRAFERGRDFGIMDGADRLKEAIRDAGLALGFARVGFAPAEPPAHGDFYLEWLERGWQGEMGWMAREDAVRRRLSPREALPGCRTLIAVALDYATPDVGGAPAAAADPLAPVVARYAGLRDYHGVFEERLAVLAERLGELAPGARTLPYVDYGPVLERDHAQRAGLGWIGKNTVLIDPRLGSYLLLGELLTTLELRPDEPFTADRCGTCARCIEACPTDAIRGPRELDARRCISYLTIELRGPIPEELRPLIGNRIFGCDICQEVCPWNSAGGRGDTPPGEREMHEYAGRRADGERADASPLRRPLPGKPAPPDSMIEWAEELLALEDEDFRARYRGTVFYRPGRDGMLRNLCIGLGNSGRAEALPVLRLAAGDPSELVREHAIWALKRLHASGSDRSDGSTLAGAPGLGARPDA